MFAGPKRGESGDGIEVVQVAQAREAVSRLGEGRARARAESRLATLEGQLAAKEAEQRKLRRNSQTTEITSSAPKISSRH